MQHGIYIGEQSASGCPESALECDVDERFAREAHAVEHEVNHKRDKQTGGEGADVGKDGSGRLREVVPVFAEGGGHDGEVI